MGRRVPRYVKQLQRQLKAGQLPTVQPGTVSLMEVAHEDGCQISGRRDAAPVSRTSGSGGQRPRRTEVSLVWPDNVLPFPKRHRGDPLARQFALARRHFHWQPQAAVWQRGALGLTDFEIDTMAAGAWEAFLAHLDAPACPTCGRAWTAGLA
jgi:hypothetical protein